MDIRKKILFTVLLILIAGLMPAADAKENPLLKRAAREYRSLRYTPAIKLLKRVLRRDPANVGAQEMIAGSYRNIRDYDQALFWYEKLSRQKELKAEWALYYAEALANRERYEASHQWYRKYLGLMSSDQRAGSFVKAYPDISDFSRNQDEWQVSYTNLNTAASEYSPVYFKEGLLFSSNRDISGTSKHVFEWDETPYTDLYTAQIEEIREVNVDSLMFSLRKNPGKYRRSLYRFDAEDKRASSRDTLGRILSEGIKTERLPGEINTKYHEGPAVLLPDNSLMFTRNNYYKSEFGTSSEGINMLKLYTAVLSEPGKIIEFPYNNDQYSVGHPAISKGGDLLIFASDMPGGYGGTDLYYCTINSEAKTWNNPVNMGKEINTEGNEMFPYLYSNDVLFFSSTGHAGLGGLDIFLAGLDGVKPLQAPVNLGFPLNSPGDDFGLIKSEDGKSGFLSSNRRGGDDIYSFRYRPFQVALRGIVRDAKTKEPLSNNMVEIRSGEKRDALITNAAGEFYRVLEKQTDFQLSTSKEQYSSDRTFASSKGIIRDSTIQVVLELSKAEIPQVSVMNNCDSLKKVFATEPVYYDLDKSDIRNDALPELDKLAGLMQSHNEITVMATSYCDSRASNKYNIDLSLRRSQSAKNYLVSKGIDESRIKVEYHGESRLVNRCQDGVDCTETEQQLNRRTEFSFILNGVNLSLLNCRIL